ncbi:transmembrane protein 177-like [Teleopsis dalmanni]|uniref:transmembrane protein 177-like n=1 Tax=Teleopsis dalmanni TaxID=139649 RepID=UPI0018CD55A0|nr:transmembrane protein 177-like [Teleopsis dalmanni]
MNKNLTMNQPKKRSFFEFFVTKRGRQTTLIVSGATAVSLFMGNFLPHTFGLGYYKDFVQSYQNGIPREVPENVKQRLEKAMDILQLRRYERLIIRPFTVVGFDLFQAGSIKYRFGSEFGIPVNYSYASPNDIKRSEIRFRDKEINWNSESGKLLEESIVLTEQEQIFSFCKSILQLQTHKILMNSIFPSITFIGMYAVGNYVNLRNNFYARPLALRLVMYSILGLFGLGSWSFMKDFNQVTYDADIDKKLCELGPDFVEVGTTYYEKLLKRNMALRALLNNDQYTAKGNENYLIRQKTIPLTLRKSFFEGKLKELQSGTQTENEVA